MKDQPLKNREGLTETEFLAAYDPNRYGRPSVTVDLLIFTVTDEETGSYRRLPGKALKLLLVRRADHPFLGQWALPGGFVRTDESLDEAAVRELREETNVERVYLEQLYTWGDVRRDPRTRVISASYLSLADSSCLDVKAGSDAGEAGWFTVVCRLTQERKTFTPEGHILAKTYSLSLRHGETELSAEIEAVKTVEGRVSQTQWKIVHSEGLAFDHAKLIAYAVERLRGKIKYTDIAFCLMPERFTLTELQKVYEVILDKELLKANFRRKLAGKVIETDGVTKDGGHRPAKLYHFNAAWADAAANEEGRS